MTSIEGEAFSRAPRAPYDPPAALARTLSVRRDDVDGWPVFTVTPLSGGATGDVLSIPQLSPINGPLENLGSVTVLTGTRDILNPDARRFAELAGQRPGSSVSLREHAGMVHAWMLLPVPEAGAAVDEIVGALTA